MELIECQKGTLDGEAGGAWAKRPRTWWERVAHAEFPSTLLGAQLMPLGKQAL
jgi:hypothetical protein